MTGVRCGGGYHTIMAGKGIVQARFLTGPNLHADHSVLLVESDFGVSPAALRRPARLDFAAIEPVVAGYRFGPVIAALKGLREAAAGEVPLIEAIIDLTARLQEVFVVRGARGRILTQGEQTLTALVPGDHEPVALQAWILAVSLGISLAASRAIEGRAADELGKLAERFVQTGRQFAPGQMTLAVVRGAAKLDIPHYRSGFDANRLQLGQGRFARVAERTMVDPFSTFAITHVRNKWLTVQRLREMGLPTLASEVVADADQAVAAAARIGHAVAVKPVASDKGVGISLDMRTPDEVREAYRLAAKSGPRVLVERFGQGDDHRALVIGGKLIACAKRLPARVVGDGVSTVAQLVAVLNSDPRRGPKDQMLMEWVEIDGQVRDLLARQGLTPESVPEAEQSVQLSLAGNISQGGTAHDVTEVIHPENREAVERAAQVLRVGVTGIDFLSPDIGRSWREGAGWILEVNAPVGLRPQWLANPAQDVITPILRTGFPEGAPVRIPTAAVTGSLGKTTTCQMLAQIARAAGKTPGLSTTQGVWSGDFRVARRDASSGAFAARLLTDPTIDCGIFEFARGALLKWGMVVDAVDVAGVLNVHDNHLGLDGVETREQLASVKAIIVRSARQGVVLNAEDPLVLAMRPLVREGAALTLVGRDPACEELVRHAAAGGCVAALAGDAIRLSEDRRVIMELPLSGIPATRDGRAGAPVANAIFAVAIAHRLGLAEADIRKGLASFRSDATQNPGRHNWIEGLPFALLLNWSDGPVAMAELGALSDREPVAGSRRIMLSSVGNRPDDWIREIGRAAAGHFDRYYCADMVHNLRGREPGAVPALLAEGLRRAGVADHAIAMIHAPADPIPAVLAEAQPGDRIMLTTYETDEALAQIEAWRSGLREPT